MADKVIVKDYKALFDPEKYLHTFYGDINAQDDITRVLFRGIHEAFKNGSLHGDRLLDIGTGPSICSVISAAPQFEEIYLSDFTEQNRSSLNNWLTGSPGHSFQAFFEYFLKLENKETHWSVREEELRRKVKGILKCDVLQPQILTEGDVGQFDVITSSLCLEAAATDLGCYRDICRKIGALLKDGGHVVLVGVLEQTFYVHGGNNFYTLPINKQELTQAWEDAGFSVLTWLDKKAPPAEENPFSDYKAGFVLAARKN